MSGRASSIPYDHLDMCERSFSEYRERFGTVEGKAGGSVPETGVALTVIGCVRRRNPQVILDRLNTKPM